MIRIADLSVDWQKENDSFADRFVSANTDDAVMSVSFSDKMHECHSVQYTDVGYEHFLRGKSGDVLFANRDWSEAVSYYLSDYDRDLALPLAAICSRYSYFNALLIHSSFVKLSENGVLFTGFSGVGKTTQAELWAEYLNADIVNGDKSFIREINGSFFAYGLPWKGSSEYCLNEKALLSAIVVLRQSKENRITRLNGKAAEYLIPHIFFPHWDKYCLDQSLDTFDRLLRSVPVFLLECRPDKDAVKLAYNTVLGDLWKN